MAYDKDLDFLGEMESEDLDILVSTLTHDKDNEKRWTESLTSSDAYKRYHPNHQKYLGEIIDELQRFAGNTIANTFRSILPGRNGVPYKEALCDVCDKCKVNYNKNSEVERIEGLLLQKILEDSMEKMSKEELEKLSREFGLDKTHNIGNLAKGNYATMIMQSVIQAGGFASYKIALIVANAVAKQMLGRGLTLAMNATLTRTIGMFAGPLGWALTALWTACDFAGPAYRVTIPAIIQVAYLRQQHKMKREEIEGIWQDLMENNENNLNNAESKKPEELEVVVEKAIRHLLKREVNLLIVGATGVGKSSTIKALFDIDVEVGVGMKPTTMKISKYQKDNLIIYDSPGLGEEKDEEHKRKIRDLLYQKDNEGKMLIDAVLVLIDFSSRDFGTAYKFIKEVIPQELKKEKRVIVAANKCDVVKPRKWNEEENKPDEEMKAFLDREIKAVQERIEEGGGLNLGDSIMYYSAGKHNEKGEYTREPYNIGKLFYYIMQHIPTQKRVALVSRRNNEETYRKSNDGKYEEKIEKSWWESVKEWIEENKDTLIGFGKIILKYAWDNRDKIIKTIEKISKKF